MIYYRRKKGRRDHSGRPVGLGARLWIDDKRGAVGFLLGGSREIVRAFGFTLPVDIPNDRVIFVDFDNISAVNNRRLEIALCESIWDAVEPQKAVKPLASCNSIPTGQSCSEPASGFTPSYAVAMQVNGLAIG